MTVVLKNTKIDSVANKKDVGAAPPSKYTGGNPGTVCASVWVPFIKHQYDFSSFFFFFHYFTISKNYGMHTAQYSLW